MAEPYVDEAYYKSEYMGEPVESADFQKLAVRATRLIDTLTDYQIPKIGLDKFTTEVQEQIKNACCTQIEFYQVEGVFADISGSTASGGSVSISSFSYSGVQSNSKQANRVAPACLTFLDATGLLRKRSVRIGVI